MSNMVYLICSLPSLTFGQVPPISLEEFAVDTRNQLSKKHFALVEAANIQKMNSDKQKGKLASVGAMMSDLQQDISEIRNAKAQKRNPSLARLPKTILGSNPLERERQIMQWQWEELDSIESGETFTLIQVMVYKLKLQILSRLNSFSVERGSQVLASVVNPSLKEEA